MRPLSILLLLAALAVVARGVAATGLAPGLGVGGLLYAAFLVAFMLPLLALLWRQLARPGRRTMVLTAGVSLVGATGLLPITGLLTLFAGFATSRSQLLWLFHLWGLIGLLVVLGALAAFGQRRLAVPGAAVGWPSAIGASALYVLAAHAAAFAVGKFEVATQQDAQGHRYRAAEALRQIARCAHAAATGTAPGGSKGFPVDLSTLGPGGTGCLDTETASGRSPDYTLDYVAAPADASGRITAFSLCAMPTHYPRGGTTTIAAHSGLDEVVQNGDPKRAAPMSCGEAWMHGAGPTSALAGVSACAIRYVRARPQIGYPATLADLGVVGCEALAKGVTYRPGPAGGTARTRFEAVASGSVWGHHGRFFIDESGVLRFAAQGEAGRDSTPWREVLAAEAAAQRSLAERRATEGEAALAACERGEAAACDRYAEHALFDLNRSDEAERHFRRSCDAGHERACLSIVSSDPAANEAFHVGVALRRQCRDGQARACEGLSRLRRGMTRDEGRALEDWVRSGDR